ncbi:MAG TPA: hypothetical protein VL633_04705 [Bacteroidota bacterium]|jgi:uncharacterized protein YoxC|nr:hypothetical protein [Bacteroidota bacterium]
METALLVMEIIALAAVSTLCVALVVVLIRVKNLLGIVEHDLKAVSAKAIPVLENLESITGNVKLVTDAVSEQVDSIRDSFASLKEVTESLVSFERRIQETIETPVMDTVDTIASVFRGIQNLIERLPFLSRLRAQ